MSLEWENEAKKRVIGYSLELDFVYFSLQDVMLTGVGRFAVKRIFLPSSVSFLLLLQIFTLLRSELCEAWHSWSDENFCHSLVGNFRRRKIFKHIFHQDLFQTFHFSFLNYLNFHFEIIFHKTHPRLGSKS